MLLWNKALSGDTVVARRSRSIDSLRLPCCRLSMPSMCRASAWRGCCSSTWPYSAAARSRRPARCWAQALSKAEDAVDGAGCGGARWLDVERQHRLYFLPLPHGQGSLAPGFAMGMGRLRGNGKPRRHPDEANKTADELYCRAMPCRLSRQAGITRATREMCGGRVAMAGFRHTIASAPAVCLGLPNTLVPSE